MPKPAAWPLLARWRPAWKLSGAGPLHARPLHTYVSAPPLESTVLRVWSELAKPRIACSCAAEIGGQDVPAGAAPAAVAPPSSAAAARAAACSASVRDRRRMCAPFSMVGHPFLLRWSLAAVVTARTPWSTRSHIRARL